jgi:hypothetical protein
VKAACVYNFAKFVDWPAETLPADGTFVIGVLGTDPLTRAIEESLGGKTVLDRRIVVRAVRDAADAARCQILFVASSEESALPRLVAELEGTPTLTISDGERLAERGVMIAFVTRARKVRFEINLDSAERSRLKLSSQLLKLATQVVSRPS